jgi:hypothetical protein
MLRTITNKPNELDLTVIFNKKGEGNPYFVASNGGGVFFTGAITAAVREKDKSIQVLLLCKWKVFLTADKKTMTWVEAPTRQYDHRIQEEVV